MEQQIYLLFILIFCVLLRVYPRIKLKYGITPDSFAHMKLAEEIRNNNFKIYDELKNSVIKIEYSYPYLYHWLLALFSDKSRLWAERFTGAFFDSLNVLIIAYFCTWYLNFHELHYPYLTVSIGFLYAVSPALLRWNGGPRSFNGSPRIMAQTLYLLHIFAYLVFHETGSYLFLLLSLFFGGLLLIGSTFGTQVLLFFSLIFGILFSPYYFLVLLGSLLMVLVISRGKVIRVLRGHFGHARFLAERISQQRPYQSTTPKYISNMKSFFQCLFKFQFKRAVPYFLDENYPFHNFLFYYPFFFILLKVSYFNEHRFLYVSVLAAVVLYIFTSFKRFRFLGEPVRYLDYVLVPAMMLTYFFLNDTANLWLFYGFTLFATVSVVYFMHQFYKSFFTIDGDFLALKKYFSEINNMEKGNLFAFNSNGHLSYYFSQQPIVNALIGNLDVRLFSKEDSDLVIGNYPLPGKDFEKIISQFNVKYIVITQNELSYYTTKILESPAQFHSRVQLLFESKTAMFFKVI